MTLSGLTYVARALLGLVALFASFRPSSANCQRKKLIAQRIEETKTPNIKDLVTLDIFFVMIFVILRDSLRFLLEAAENNTLNL